MIDERARAVCAADDRLDDDDVRRAAHGQHAFFEDVAELCGDLVGAAVGFDIFIFTFRPRDFDESELFYIARNSRLGGVEPLFAKQFDEFALSADLVLVDDVEVGDSLEIPVDPRNFEYSAVQSAKQRSQQVVKEYTTDKVYIDAKAMEGKLVIGEIKRQNPKNGDYIVNLAEGLVDLGNIFRPQAIIIGGGLSAQGDYLIAPVREYVNGHLFAKDTTPQVEILQAKLGNNAGVIGAASLFVN